MKKRISTLLCLLALAMTSMQAKDYNVKDFGAIGNGKVLDHHAINTAIDSCVPHGAARVYLTCAMECRLWLIPRLRQ